MPSANIDAFISYSHDSPEHEDRVRVLADRLRADGIDAVIDQYVGVPPEGWQLWMEKRIRDAKFVLLVCTETYLRRVVKEEVQGKGLGVLWESTLIYSYLYDAGGVNEKFIPVVFGHGDARFIPQPLKPTTFYDVSTGGGYELLYSRLTDQPLTPAPPLGTRRVVSPPPRPSASPIHAPTPAPTPPLPATLAPNLVHPYLMQANFTGRAAERAELTAWLADDARPVCALIAIGGMGKSALAWQWVTKDVLASHDAALPAGEAVMWWSFYEGESSFAKFIDEALKYVSGQPVIDAERLPTTYDRAQELRQLLLIRRALFILDGFERQLRAYASLDAAYRPDDATDLSQDARTCVDPTAARFLRDIVSGTTRAKVLLTTRLMVRDLEDRAGDALAGVFKRELKELPREDAIAFMHAQGVKKGTDAEIAAACEAYGYHPLSLRLLSGLIARDAKMPGDIAAAPRHDVHADLIQRQHHVLEQAYEALPKRESALLSRIAAFRNPVTYDALSVFNTLGNEARFDTALEDLRARGLLQRDTAHNRYDLHPIVRHYAYDRLNNKADVHARLREYFASIPMPSEDRLTNIEDLMSVIELYHHTVRAGQYDKAMRLYYERIWQLLYYRFGAYQTEIQLLLALFPDGENHLPRLDSENAQAWTQNELANAYSLSGQPRRAVPLLNQHATISEKENDKINYGRGLINIGCVSIHLGELVAAQQILGSGIELFRAIKDRFGEAVSRQELGNLLTYLGAFDQAVAELEVLRSDWGQFNHKQGMCLGQSYLAECFLLMGDSHKAVEAARHARTLAEAMRYERDIIRAEWLLGAALVMEGNDLNDAADQLTDALTRCRRINLVELESNILLAWARWHHAQRNLQDARTHGDEALVIADRCEYRLKQAEINNFLARLALEGGDREAARSHADAARERAWCDGPPHCYKPALDEAEKMLAELV